MHRIARNSQSLVLAFLLLLGLARHGTGDEIPTLQQVMDAPRDLWGEAALKQPDGPSYEFFVPLLQPMRYCDAPFRHYPITLSAPGASVKVRFISNGSAVNALAEQPNWVSETGTPVTFRVTREMAIFGDNLASLEGPHYEQGYLPIVRLRYTTNGQTFEQEAFAPVEPELAKHGVAFVKFTLVAGTGGPDGLVEAQLKGTPVLDAAKGAISDRRGGGALVAFEKQRWAFRPGRSTLRTTLAVNQSAYLVIYTEPSEKPITIDAATYDAARKRCVAEWNALLAKGTQIQVPEKVVNDAWRANTIGNFMLLNGDKMLYSQGNQYAKLYIGEGGDATRAMLEYGQVDTARKVIPPLFTFTRKGLEFHQGSMKLQLLAHHYFLTGDKDFVKSMRELSPQGRKPGWETELNLLINGREEKSGLYPPEKYAGDIEDKVYSLNSNANGWRAIRDMAVVLEEIGEKALAEKAATSAREFRKSVMAAIEKSIDRNIKPPFIPMALFGAEKPYESIVGARLGSYWNIMTKYALYSGVFPPDHEYAEALMGYARERGGLCMGMNRNHADPDSWWITSRGINDLYTLRYTLTLLRRDEADLALVGFYGKLAHGMTRDTFIGCEGASLLPLAGNGRQMYLPPNSAANANFLEPLRYLLIQDYDMNDDGTPETLRLGFATPRRWLKDAQEIRIERAPTAFGEISFTIKSDLANHIVTADVDLPERVRPASTLLRLRLPDGRRIESAKAGDVELKLVGETIDLSALKGQVSIRATVAR